LGGVAIDYVSKTASFDLEVDVSPPYCNEPQLKTASLTIRGLEYLVVLPPDQIDDEGGMLAIDSRAGGPSGVSFPLPAQPAGTFVHTIYVVPWNSYIVVCGRSAELVLTEDADV